MTWDYFWLSHDALNSQDANKRKDSVGSNGDEAFLSEPQNAVQTQVPGDVCEPLWLTSPNGSVLTVNSDRDGPDDSVSAGEWWLQLNCDGRLVPTGWANILEIRPTLHPANYVHYMPFVGQIRLRVQVNATVADIAFKVTGL